MKQIVDCYQCQNKKSLEEYWPFCSFECKHEYLKTHYVRSEHKYQTIEQCQARLKELKENTKEKTYYSMEEIFNS